MLRSRAVQLGLLAGLGSVALAGVLVLLLSFIPSTTLRLALGMQAFPEETLDTSARGARSFLGPWLSQSTVSFEEFSFSATAVMPLATLVLVVVLVGIGLVVRRVLPTARERGLALLVAALTGAALVAVLAATLGFELESEGATLDYSFSGGTYFLVALAEILLIGAFSFGFVAAWAEPFRTAARTAAVCFGAVFVVALALFPGWVVAHDPAGRVEPARARDMANNSAWAPGAASGALPLALGAQAHFETQEFATPFMSVTEEGRPLTYLPELARYTQEHESARIAGYAGAGGTGWKLLLISGSVLLIVLWTLAGAWVVASLGAPSAVDGLRVGALVGLFGGLLVVVVSAIVPVKLASADESIFWGVSFAASIQTAAELVVLTALGGAVYAAFRPAEARYETGPLRVPTWLWPAPEQSPTGSAGDGGDFCGRCGAPFADPEDSFCRRCGAPRTP